MTSRPLGAADAWVVLQARAEAGRAEAREAQEGALVVVRRSHASFGRGGQTGDSHGCENLPRERRDCDASACVGQRSVRASASTDSHPGMGDGMESIEIQSRQSDAGTHSSEDDAAETIDDDRTGEDRFAATAAAGASTLAGGPGDNGGDDDEGGGDGKDGGDGGSDAGTLVITRTKPKPKRPNMYRVLLLNDDYTPMEFVVHVLERFFQKTREEATRVMLHVHHHGVGECGVYTYEVAETKVTQVMDFARKHQHPLQCVMEKK